MATKTLEIIEETFRDGQQSLWATRMSTREMIPIASRFNEAHFAKVNFLSGAAFEAAIKFLNEDPWERLDALRFLIPDRKAIFLIRSRNLMGWQRYSNDVVRLFIELLAKHGIEGFMVFDALNDLKNFQYHIQVGKALGLEVVGMLVFSESPIHTDEYFATKTRQLIQWGVHRVLLADASGVLTPNRTCTLFRALKDAAGDVPLEFNAHDTTGLALACYAAAIQQGLVQAVATASRPLAYGNSLPATRDVLRVAWDLGYDIPVDEQQVRYIDDYFYYAAYRRGYPVIERQQFNPMAYREYCHHQIPGGMMSNLVAQLREQRLEHRLKDVLEEAGRVRQELGYPVMVTPFSQLVGVQATLNVIEGRRYHTVPQELRLYARGFYGEPPGPLDPEVMEILTQGEAPLDPYEVFLTPMLERARKTIGASRLSDEELLIALFYNRNVQERLAREKTALDFSWKPPSPIGFLLQELTKRREVHSLRLERRRQ